MAKATEKTRFRPVGAKLARSSPLPPRTAMEIGPAEPMDGNLDGVGVAFRYLFETKGIGNGTLAVPTVSG